MAFDAKTSDAENDEALLAAYAEGDARAARLLTVRFGPRVFSHAMRLLQDRAEAEDVAQEDLLRLWWQAPDWRTGEAKVSTWLYRVTGNLCIDRIRAGRVRRATSLDAVAEPEDDSPGVEARMQDRARARALDEALSHLPERQRQAVVLRHIEGLSNPEIATIMEMSVEAVESLTARGKRALSQALAGRREELGYDDA